MGGASKTLYVGNYQNICDLITYGDNYVKFPTCTINGEYNFDKEGKYNIEIIVTDSSNNSTNFNMTINIIKPKETNNTNNTTKPSKVLFSEVYNTYKSENTKIWIDGDVDINVMFLK